MKKKTVYSIADVVRLAAADRFRVIGRHVRGPLAATRGRARLARKLEQLVLSLVTFGCFHETVKFDNGQRADVYFVALVAKELKGFGLGADWTWWYVKLAIEKQQTGEGILVFSIHAPDRAVPRLIADRHAEGRR